MKSFLFIALTVAAASGATAGTLTSAYNVQMNGAFHYYNNSAGPGTYTDSPVSVVVSASPAASITADVNIPNGSVSGNGGATVTYFMEFAGPDSVPLTIDMTSIGNVTVSGTASQQATAYLFFNGAQVWWLTCTADFFNCAGNTAKVNETDQFTITSNTPYEVDLSASVSSGNYTGSAHAFIDPSFTLDPGASNPAGYSLVLSDGFGNSTASPIPEPATLMLVGVSIAALAFRRKLNANFPR